MTEQEQKEFAQFTHALDEVGHESFRDTHNRIEKLWLKYTPAERAEIGNDPQTGLPRVIMCVVLGDVLEALTNEAIKLTVAAAKRVAKRPG